MDALPILEANSVAYASQNPGVMHACGHDAHMTVALGTARIMADIGFPGTLRFLFQPSEEVADEQGISGAPRMIAEGAMENVQTILALHVDSSQTAGEILLKSGVASAGVDTFYASVLGKGGHGAKPHEVVDPIYLSGLVILALHGIVSRRLHPFDPAVVSIGTIHGGQIDNVIPDQVDLSGTLRFMDSAVQKSIHSGVESAFTIARNLGGDYRLRFEIGYPPMVNDPAVIDTIREVVNQLLGPEHVHTPKMEMGAEDFGYMSSLAPGAMFQLGCARPGEDRKLHSPVFDIDEDCLPVGVAIMSQTALIYLTKS
jgi:amidohydrolase